LSAKILGKTEQYLGNELRMAINSRVGQSQKISNSKGKIYDVLFQEFTTEISA
jgi:hypothetical protein